MKHTKAFLEYYSVLTITVVPSLNRPLLLCGFIRGVDSLQGDIVFYYISASLKDYLTRGTAV
jgi:hypothetical protein